jgi:hypothetical protein
MSIIIINITLFQSAASGKNTDQFTHDKVNQARQ